jgi:hypothetical protein
MARSEERFCSADLTGFRLADLRPWHVIEAICGQCNRATVLHHDALLRRRNPETLLIDLEAKLRCGSCDRVGTRAPHALVLKMAPRD